MNEPTVMCGGFGYEEGADLDPDEVVANQRLLPVLLDQLPGGGIKHGSILSISDQAQDFSCQMIVTHKVHRPVDCPGDWERFPVGGRGLECSLSSSLALIGRSIF